MKNLLFIFSFLILACESQPNVDSDDFKSNIIHDLMEDIKGPICPKNHKDSIVPIVYGYPSEELFAKSDSGLVVLGGCELGEENYFCKIHKISF
ncbi:MAG: hypothetical protein GQ574_18855 [Crocinitomix sp.]|nr:hypothetical protein [Crocinitomix sp.]